MNWSLSPPIATSRGILTERAQYSGKSMSDSSIVPERQLVFSPGLAATIGLEEAVLLQHLHALFEHRPAELRKGHAWLNVEREFLLGTLPFWSTEDLQRITRSLADKGVLLCGPELVCHLIRVWYGYM